MRKMTTWAVLGSVLISVMLALVIAAAFSVAPTSPAEACADTQPPAHATQSPVRGSAVNSSAVNSSSEHHRYLIAVRMGWAS